MSFQGARENGLFVAFAGSTRVLATSETGTRIPQMLDLARLTVSRCEASAVPETFLVRCWWLYAGVRRSIPLTRGSGQAAHFDRCG
jgi:hypothetical protein